MSNLGSRKPPESAFSMGCAKLPLTMCEWCCYICKVPRVHFGLPVVCGLSCCARKRVESPEKRS